jgi:hypothetical protein
MREELTMDLTPSWETVVEFYIEWLQRGTEKQKQLAKDDLRKLAKTVDEYNEELK